MRESCRRRIDIQAPICSTNTNHRAYLHTQTSRPTDTPTSIIQTSWALRSKYTTIIIHQYNIIRKEKRTNAQFEMLKLYFALFSSHSIVSIRNFLLTICFFLLFFGPIAIDFIRLHDHYDDVDCLEPRKVDHVAYASPSTIYDAISAYILTRVAIRIGAFDTNMRVCASKQFFLH